MGYPGADVSAHSLALPPFPYRRAHGIIGAPNKRPALCLDGSYLNPQIEMDGRLMSLPWQNVTQQIVMSVEAPDFDTHVASALITNTTNARRSGWSRAYRQIYFSYLGVFALFGLLSVWWTSSSMGWFFFWIGFVSVLGTLIFQYFLTVRRVTGRNSNWDSAAAVIVRNAAIVGDSKNAPLAQIQPTLPAIASTTPEPTTITDLYRPITLIVPGTASSALIVTQSISLVVIIGALVAFVIANNFLNFMNGLGNILPWQYPALYLIAIVASLGGLIQQQRLRRPFSVTIDAQGVIWRKGRKRRAESWSAAQALCTVDMFPMGGAFQPQRIYWLQFPDGALAWASKPLPVWTRAQSKSNAASSTDDAAWRLCSIAAQRTGLPLRDMTGIAMRLTAFSPRLDNARQALAPETPMYISEPEQARVAAQRAQRRRQVVIRFGGQLVYALSLAALAAGLYFGGPVVYGAELTQAERSARIFNDPLLSKPNTWQTVGSSDLALLYGDDGMQMTGCCNEFALANHPVSDGVIEVTLHTVSDFDLADAGLVLRANTQTNQALYFSITPGGGWRLTRGNMTSDGTVSNDLVYEGLFTPVLGIHTGSDVTNRLAVIMHGSNYTFFVNGRYIGSYHDNKIAGNLVGVYSDGTQQTAAFSDFAIYPEPPLAFSWL